MSLQQRSSKKNTKRQTLRAPRRVNYSDDRPMVVRESIHDSLRNPDVGLARNLTQPMQFAVVPTDFRKIRFLAQNTIASQTFSFQDLIKMRCFSTAVNTAYAKVSAVKLKYVEVWEPFQGLSTANVAGITWEGSGGTNTGINRNFYVESAGPDKYSHLYSTPPSDTLIGYWQQKTSTSTAFILKNLSLGTIVDIAFDYQEADDDAVASLGPFVVVAAAAGLNGIHSPTTLLVAQGLNNM